MGTEQFSVVHLDTGTEWRGGQQQAAWLHESLVRDGVRSVLVCPHGSPLSKWCARRELPVRPMYLGGEWNVAASAVIASICRARPGAILHAHTSHALGLGLWARMMAPRTRLVATRRLDFHVGGNMVSRWKYSSRLVDAVVCISEGVRRVMIADRIPERKLVTIHDGVDMERFRESQTVALELAGIPAGTIVVGTIAAMVGHKDYPTLMKAARIVLNTRSDIVFWALGDGARRSALEQLHAQLGLGSRFVLAGFRTDVGEWLRRCDIFALSSREEGLGSSLLDAISLGIPVVATKVGGIPDVIRDGIEGLLVPRSSPEEFARAILALADEPGKRTTMSHNARERAREFTVQVMLERHLQLYRQWAR